MIINTNKFDRKMNRKYWAGQNVWENTNKLFGQPYK